MLPISQNRFGERENRKRSNYSVITNMRFLYGALHLCTSISLHIKYKILIFMYITF